MREVREIRQQKHCLERQRTRFRASSVTKFVTGGQRADAGVKELTPLSTF